jgi:hypothetical protein
MTSTNTLSRIAAPVLVLSVLLVASFAYAQERTSADLQATIRASIKTDPRAAGLTEAQLDQLAARLTQEAQAQGVSAADILWRPTTVPPEGAGERLGGVPFVLNCGNENGVLCRINNALGLDGTNLLIPLVLGIAAALLLLVLAILFMHHKHVEPQLLKGTPPPLF